MATYTCYYDKCQGYCALIKCRGFWQECSKYYTTLARLNLYWGKPRKIKFLKVYQTVTKN